MKEEARQWIQWTRGVPMAACGTPDLFLEVSFFLLHPGKDPQVLICNEATTA